VLDGLRWALFLLVVINVSRVHQSVALLGKARPGLLLVFLAGVVAVLNPRKTSYRDLFKTTEAKLVLSMFIVTCLSAVAGISLGNSAKFLLERYSKVIIAAFLLLVGIRHVRDLYAMIWAYVVGSGILAFMAVFVFKMSKRAGSEVTRLQELHTFDANDIGVVLLIALPLALLMARHSAGLRKWFSIGVVVAIGVALARSGSRGTLVGLVGTGAVLLMALKTIPLWKRVTFVGVVVCALVAAAPPGYWVQMKTLLGLEQDYNWSSKDGRRQLIIRGLTYMFHYPITGLGIDNFGRAECMSDLSEKVRTHVRGTGIKCAAPHNTYLQVGAETGFTGLIIWGLLIFGGIKRMRRLRRKLPSSWRVGDPEQRFIYDATLYLPVAFVAFAITSTFVTFAWLDIFYIAVVFVAGLTIVARKRLTQESASRVVTHPQGAVSLRVPASLPVS
jgi:O-antigen ligase